MEGRETGQTDVLAALRGGGFASALERGAALVVVGGEPLRLIHATPAALRLFEAESTAALEAVLVLTESPGSRRLRRLVETLRPGGAPRLEQLRFFVRGAPLTLGLTAAKIGGPEETPWLALAGPHAGVKGEPVGVAEVEPPPPVVETRPQEAPVRFLWALDAANRMTEIGEPLAVRLGDNAPGIGESLAELEARLALGDAWSQAVSARSTFSGVRLEWPVAGAPFARVTRLSGAPLFDPVAGFVGFRGFGVFTGESVERAVPPPVIAPPAAAEPPHAEPELKPGAEIYVLRPGVSPAANIVPIRSPSHGTLTALPDVGDTNPNAMVELTPQERDAFREIARALGAPQRGEPADFAHPPSVREMSEAGSPEDFETLTDALPIGAIVIREGEAVYANRALLEFAGHDSLESFRANDGLAAMFRGRAPEHLLEGGEDAPVVAAEGELTTVHASATPIVWSHAPATLVSIRRSREVEHRERELELESEARAQGRLAHGYLSALDQVAGGFGRVDANGRILMMSAAAEAMFGHRPNEAQGSNFLTLLAPQSQGPALAAFLGAMSPDAERWTHWEGQARAAGGRVFSCRMAFGRFVGAEPPEAFVSFEDRERASAEQREREASRAEAVEANERKTEFLAFVSHEIRTPLQAILGFAEVMMEERFGPIGNERYKEYLRDIHASGKHVISLANDLIDLAKIEAGKMELDFAPTDANQIIRDCVALMQPQAARERIIMRMSLADKLPNVIADARSLRQIMLNLMSNAVKFNEPGGQVIVSTAIDEAGQAIIRVRDTGVGMSESELQLALEPFRRPEGGKIADGAGLGLPLTKALVEANHADFSIKSRKEQGTLVEIAFSVARAAQ